MKDRGGSVGLDSKWPDVSCQESLLSREQMGPEPHRDGAGPWLPQPHPRVGGALCTLTSHVLFETGVPSEGWQLAGPVVSFWTGCIWDGSWECSAWASLGLSAGRPGPLEASGHGPANSFHPGPSARALAPSLLHLGNPSIGAEAPALTSMGCSPSYRWVKRATLITKRS